MSEPDELSGLEGRPAGAESLDTAVKRLSAHLRD